MRTKLSSILITQLIMWILLFLILFPKEWRQFDLIWTIAASFFLLYLPWYWIWYIFFGEDELSAFERFILNFLISFTLLIIISYYLYYTWVWISSIKIYIFTFALLFLSMVVVLIRRRNYSDRFDDVVYAGNDLIEE